MKDLKNDGSLEIIPIGVGSMLSGTHFNTNYLIIKGDTHILVDCGRTAPEALRQLGVNLADVSVVLPTHAHDDHVGGIGSLAVANRYVAVPQHRPKLTMIAPRHFARSLWDENLRGNLAHNELGADHRGLEFGDWFDLVTPEVVSFERREESQLDFGGVSLRMFRTMHVPDAARGWSDSHWSIGMLVDEKVWISGDTRFDRELIEAYAPRATLIFHDCAFFEDPVHASVAKLRTLPEEIRRKMHLIHYGDNYASQDVAGFAGLARQGVSYAA